MVATPRIRTAALASGAPSCAVTITPAADPFMPSAMFTGAFLIISSALTETTEPAISLFLTVP
jgi:hypothetical protein